MGQYRRNFAARGELFLHGQSGQSATPPDQDPFIALPAGERRSASRIAEGGRGIWQRRYWEHTLRDERDLARHVDYIHNPKKQTHAERARDRPYSSFHRCVPLGSCTADQAGPSDPA